MPYNRNSWRNLQRLPQTSRDTGRVFSLSYQPQNMCTPWRIMWFTHIYITGAYLIALPFTGMNLRKNNSFGLVVFKFFNLYPIDYHHTKDYQIVFVLLYLIRHIKLNLKIKRILFYFIYFCPASCNKNTVNLRVVLRHKG